MVLDTAGVRAALAHEGMYKRRIFEDGNIVTAVAKSRMILCDTSARINPYPDDAYGVRCLG